MIERYTRPEMGLVWDLHTKFAKMMEVEITVAEVQAKMKLIPLAAAKDIRKKSKFSIRRISEIEQKTKHDVIAFVSNLAENVGKNGKYIHYGLTSSDVLDTALSLQIREAGEVLLRSMLTLKRSLKNLIAREADTLCPGRTHGMYAEPTSFGVKIAGFLEELRRNEKRVSQALDQLMICKLSGAVGTYSSLGPEVEKAVAVRLGLRPEKIATQVVPRDRHAELFLALSLLCAGIERLAVEMRHLQRSEVAEVTEGFAQGQKGSSAMPHKKNPISSENVTGLARLMRSYAQAALENIALWHERDISHSSVERVIFPDAFIVADYAVHRMAQLMDGLIVNRKKMSENIADSQGLLFSSQILLALVRKGLAREEAYSHVQRIAHSIGRGDSLEKKLIHDPDVRQYLKAKEISEIFSGKKLRKTLKAQARKALTE